MSNGALFTSVLSNSHIPLQGTAMGRLLFTCFVIYYRVNVEKQGLLGEVNEGILEPQAQRSVIVTLEESIL